MENMSKKLLAAAAAACCVDDFTLNNIFKRREKFLIFFSARWRPQKIFLHEKAKKSFLALF